jgi:hypothetical protein
MANMTFLDVVESVRAEQASVQHLFGGEGTGVRTGGHRGQNYSTMLAEAAKLVADVYAGRKYASVLKEAMSTSDFPYLFGDILDRQLLAAYQQAPSTYQNYVKVSTVRDFRTVQRHYLDGGTAKLDAVAENASYPAAKRTEGKYSYSVKKYGRRFPFTWETFINDDLDALKDIPMILGQAAKYSEEYFATDLFVGSAGPDSTFYASGNANIVTSNPVLSVAGLQTAMTVLGNMVNSDSVPIVIEAYELVVPPALEVTAMNILNGLELRLNENGGATNSQLITTNWMKGRFRLNVNHCIPRIAASNQNTSWFLFAKPAAGQRVAVEMGFLRGHEQPEVFMKAPNATRVGGGAANPMDGDFDTDGIEYKVRHVFGGTTQDPKLSVASNGSGS